MSQPPRFFSPAETARRLKVSTKALRLYETLGLVKPVRTSTGWRTYGPDQMARLHQVLALKYLGLPLRRVGELLNGELADLDAVLLLQEKALRARIADDASRLELLVAVRRRLACGETLSVDDLIHLTRETVMTDLPELPNPYQGKVRDNYDLPDGRRVIVASDRLSAFDLNLCAVPYKGQVLTQTARYWFDITCDICPNHVIAYPDPNVLVCRRLEMLPVEMVVRGYLAGTTSTSVLTLYQAGQREMYGVRLPDGMRPNQKLPAPILTPTSKEFQGGHDAPLSPAQILTEGLLTAAQWEEVSALSLALFARGQAMAAERGLILADTKYEFGTDAEGRILLADEIHTPDSSRFWCAASYESRFAADERPESFDKDFVRSWVAARCDPYHDEIPPIPASLILATSAVYIEAFETITGQSFTLPDPGEDLLARVRRNLAGM